LQVQKAIRLGALHQTLGIPAESRVTYQFTQTGGVVIVDLNAGVQYEVEGRNVAKNKTVINPRVKELLAATDEQLKQVWNSSRGWDDERELVFTELCERGVDMLDRDVL
jgi:hypothetical protein